MTVRTCIDNSTAVAMVLVVGLGTSTIAKADDAYAKTRMKAMSDYMAKQTALSA